MTKEEIIVKATEVLAEEFEIDATEITPEASLKDTLGLDSLDLVDVVVLVERYPELKSNELVKQQLDLYIENNEEIKDLKLEQLKKYKYELWLFFDLKVD